MLRLLIADVTLLKGDNVRAQVRFNGGAAQTLHVPLPLRSWMVTQTPAAVVAEIDRLFDHHTAGEIAAVLNQNGVISGAGHRFNRLMVTQIRKSYKLKTRRERLRARGLLTAHQIGKLLDVSYCTVKIWRRAGLLVGHRYNDKGQCYFEHPITIRSSIATKPNYAVKQPHPRQTTLQSTPEVHYAAYSFTCGEYGKVGRCKIPK